MTQKPSTEKLGSTLLQTIDPKEIAEERMRQTVESLLNLIEELNSKVIELDAENQRLKDEINRLKGEQGKPDIKANKKKGLKKDYSSEKERKTTKNHRKSRKKAQIKIDRSEIVEYPPEKLPEDAEFKGYEEVIVQDIVLKTDNVRFRKQKFYSAQTGKTYLAPLPAGYEGEFGPGIKALVKSLYYGGNMTQGKLLEFFAQELELILNDFAYELLGQLKLPTKWQNCLKLLPQETALTETEFKILLDQHPELPLHNNPAELGARTMVQRRNISYATQTIEGTKAWDIFLSLVATTRKLGISFFEYIRDRISQLGNIPSLATIIREQSSLHSFDGSWIPE